MDMLARFGGNAATRLSNVVVKSTVYSFVCENYFPA
jgi:hypothetical protein